MTHLTESELVDLVDGLLPAGRATHLTECEACRSEADSMRAVLSRAAASDVPEPSPLFWSHLSDNVRHAVAELAIERGGWFGWLRPGRAWAAAAALATLVLAVGTWLVAPTSPERTPMPGA